MNGSLFVKFSAARHTIFQQARFAKNQYMVSGHPRCAEFHLRQPHDLKKQATNSNLCSFPLTFDATSLSKDLSLKNAGRLLSAEISRMLYAKMEATVIRQCCQKEIIGQMPFSTQPNVRLPNFAQAQNWRQFLIHLVHLPFFPLRKILTSDLTRQHNLKLEILVLAELGRIPKELFLGIDRKLNL